MRPAVVTTLVLAVLALPAAAVAAPGDLDETFSQDGLVEDGAPDAVIDAAVAPDGSVVVAQHDNFAGVIARYSAAGQPAGSVADGLGPGGSAIGSITVRADGRVLVGGTAFPTYGNDFTVAELRPDGAPACGGEGLCVVTTDFAGGKDKLTDVVPGQSGGAIAAGIVTDGGEARLGVARYLPSGALDGSFSGDGKLIFDSGGVATFARRAVVAGLPDGSALLAGAGPGPDGEGAGDLLVAKLEPDGDLDPAFGGGDGWATLDLDGRDDAESIVVAPDGEVYVGIDACDFGLTTDCDAAIARFTPAGELDSGFGSAGIVRPAAGSQIALGPGGSVYAAGTTELREHFGYDFALGRYTASGTPDPVFAGDGFATADFGLGSDQGLALGVGADGRPVVGGYAGGEEVQRIGLARFEVADGPPDADADGVLDPDDACPERFAGNASGCPRIDRSTKVGEAPRGRLRVKVKSELAPCAAKQRITVIRRRPGPDGPFARPKTNGNGVWVSQKRVPEGRYRAIAKRKLVPELGRCSQARSRARQVG